MWIRTALVLQPPTTTLVPFAVAGCCLSDGCITVATSSRVVFITWLHHVCSNSLAAAGWLHMFGIKSNSCFGFAALKGVQQCSLPNVQPVLNELSPTICCDCAQHHCFARVPRSNTVWVWIISAMQGSYCSNAAVGMCTRPSVMPELVCINSSVEL